MARSIHSRWASRQTLVFISWGGLDAQGNCEVGAYEVDGEMLTGQVVLASYEVDIRQEWARTNDLIGTIKLREALIATTVRSGRVFFLGR